MLSGVDIRIRKAMAVIAALVCAMTAAHAQFLTYPLYIGSAQPVRDEFGRNLVGSATMQTDLCDRVEVFLTTNGVIYPPDIHGEPDFRNVVITGGVSCIGNHTAMGLTNSGLFSIQITDNKPPPGTILFVRAFNAPTREAASFYGDSRIFTVVAGDQSVYYVSITNMLALDTQDADGDDLHNSWEESLGSDPLKIDTDGDGLNDGQEARAGTDPTDKDSVFLMASMRVGANKSVVLAWASVSGKRYQVQYTSDDLNSNPSYSNVNSVVTAAGLVTEVTITEGFLSGGGHYRVRLVEE